MSDNIDQTSEYQEQILDDLDDIKGSLDEESEYYDKEYQKEVLQNLKAIKKTLATTSNNDLTLMSPLSNYASYVGTTFPAGISSTRFKTVTSPGTKLTYNVYDISNVDSLNFDASSINYRYYFVFTDVVPSEYFAGVNQTQFDGYCPSSIYQNSFSVSDLEYDYFYLVCQGGNVFPDVYAHFTALSSEPEIEGEHVTSGSAIELSLENIGQQVTFVGYGTAILIGLVIFLLFVKGLRQ